MESTVYTIGGRIVTEEEWNEYCEAVITDFEAEEYGRTVLENDGAEMPR